MNLLTLIFSMALVTYLPRLLPLALLQDMKLPPYCVRFMKYIPYAALAALIFPGVLSSTGSQHATALCGTIVAMVLAYFELNLLIVVMGGIAGALIAIILNI